MPQSPGYFYKYLPFDEKYSPDLFLKNEIKFSCASDFNDPFDCKIRVTLDGNEKSTRQWAREVVEREGINISPSKRQSQITSFLRRFQSNRKEIEEEAGRYVQQKIDTLGIFCLSEVSDDILMWSHYANKHSGFCLKFRDSKYARFTGIAYPVIYTEQYPIVNVLDRENLDESSRKSLLTKSPDWKHEKEWRVIDIKRGPGVRKFPPALLEAVIFGCRMSCENKLKIKKWCKDRDDHVQFFQANQSSSEYKIKIINEK